MSNLTICRMQQTIRRLPVVRKCLLTQQALIINA